MKKEYLSLVPKAVLYSWDQNSDSVFLRKHMTKKVKSGNEFVVNRITAEIIQQYNGTKTHSDIVVFFQDKYGNSVPEIHAKINKAISMLENVGFSVHRSEQKACEPESGELGLPLPGVVSLELTNSCNLKCLHCYGDYGNKSIKHFPREAITPVLRHLYESDVSILELTGGDPSVYPYLDEVLLAATSTGFPTITILTNGVNINDSTKEIIVKNKDSIIIQIDLHSLSDDYLTWFTGVRNTLKAVKDSILYFISNGVRVAISSIITPQNISEIYNLAQWAHDSNAYTIRFSLAVELGRAAQKATTSCDFSNSPEPRSVLFTKYEDMVLFENELRRTIEHFPEITQLPSVSNKRANCGALSSHITINPEGKIKFCTSDNGSFDPRIGNIIDTSLEDLYEDSKEFLIAFGNLVPPKHEDDSCKNCCHKMFCDGCLLRAFVRVKEMNGGCEWLKARVPELVRERLGVHLFEKA